MLTGLEAWQRSAVPGFELERHHILGLADLVDEPQSAHRLGVRVPPQRDGRGKLDNLFDVERNQASGARYLCHRVRLPVDHGPPRQLEEAAGPEIDEEESGSRIQNEVADRVEMIVAGVVGKE